MNAMPHLLLHRLLLACLLAGCAVAAADAAPLWKWRDANGRIHLSDRPPPNDVPERAILQRPGGTPAISYSPAAVPPGDVAPIGTAASAASAPAPAVDAELEKRRQAIQDAALKNPPPKAAPKPDPVAAAQRAENCQRARNQLAALQSGQRMARAGANGEREVLDDKGRAEETQRAQAQIQAACR